MNAVIHSINVHILTKVYLVLLHYTHSGVIKLCIPLHSIAYLIAIQIKDQHWATSFLLFSPPLCRLERVDESERLTLDSIRHSLIRQEDSIIFSLLERAQYCYNGNTYDKDVFTKDCSLVEFMVKETEKLHAQVN